MIDTPDGRANKAVSANDPDTLCALSLSLASANIDSKEIKVARVGSALVGIRRISADRSIIHASQTNSTPRICVWPPFTSPRRNYTSATPPTPPTPLVIAQTNRREIWQSRARRRRGVCGPAFEGATKSGPRPDNGALNNRTRRLAATRSAAFICFRHSQAARRSRLLCCPPPESFHVFNQAHPGA